MTTAVTVATASLQCHSAIGATLLSSSRDVGWTSLLVEHHIVEPHPAVFETVATPDQTIVVMLRGEQELEAFGAGRWKRAAYQAGTVGLTRAGKSDRLRRRAGPGVRPFEKLNMYIPAATMGETAEHLRRAGQTSHSCSLDALAFGDPLVWQTARSLRHAAASGAPDLYAQSAAHWLATHLLVRSAGDLDSAPTVGRSAPLTDRRLARVIEMMSVRFPEPITLEDLSAEAAISKFHFVRLFREKTGLTPYAMLSRFRLDASEKMLTATDLGVGEIAGRCGFAHARHFSTAFSIRFGMPPTVWRAKSRSKS